MEEIDLTPYIYYAEEEKSTTAYVPYRTNDPYILDHNDNIQEISEYLKLNNKDIENKKYYYISYTYKYNSNTFEVGFIYDTIDNTINRIKEIQNILEEHGNEVKKINNINDVRVEVVKQNEKDWYESSDTESDSEDLSHKSKNRKL